MKTWDLFVLGVLGVIITVLLDRGDPVCALSTVGRTSDGLVVDPAAPAEAIPEDAAKEEQIVPVKYNGAQLWRIDYDDQKKKNAVADLQNKYGA